MIEMQNDQLQISFPEVHKGARMVIEFQRTLRIPDDGRTHYLPPGLGRFPLKHVDDYGIKLPTNWKEHGGVFLPMYQSEALWINFRSAGYPFAVKIAAGKINAIDGNPWTNDLANSTQNGEVLQNYVVVPDQPWLDGFSIEQGVIRQFVAAPLSSCQTVEAQITGEAEHGGIQIICYPLKRGLYRGQGEIETDPIMPSLKSEYEMGLGMGGKMKQEIFKDEYGLDAWDTSNSSRCFVHIANSEQYESITGEQPPTTPPTAEKYNAAGLPWFDYYDENATPQGGSAILNGVKPINNLQNSGSSTNPTVITPDDKKKVRTGVF